MQLSALQSLSMAAAVVLHVGATQASTAPTQGRVGLKWMNYQESQQGLSRMGVQARSAFVTLPLNPQWVLDASAVVDDISGASPTYYTEPQSFAQVEDQRKAQDLRLSWYNDLQRWTLGSAQSAENDYHSRNVAVSFQQTTPDRNTTWDLAYARSHDHISPVNRIVDTQTKRTYELLAGATWVLSPQDLLQTSLTRSSSQGYLNDPYKFFDIRPRSRTVNAVSLRWNHHFDHKDIVQRLSARWSKDSFAVRSVTLQGEWSHSLAHGWSLTPLLRYYSQSGAYFFSPPDPLHPERPQMVPGAQLGVTLMSFDQRLAAFGALTRGLKIDKKLNDQTTLDLRLDHYTQKNRWSLLGKPPAGLADFKATFVQVGMTHSF